jgi:tripartite-type tricarboxylate transporter receptor subunit TctC
MNASARNVIVPHRFSLRTLSLALALASSLSMGGAALAQSYPTKPIRFIVPQSPGSATDTVARAIGHRLPERLGQPVVMENRPGAGGIIGSEAAAKAPPDGHTILIIAATHTVNPSLRPVPFDPIKDFAPITLATSQPYLMLAHPSLPVRSVKELIQLAKARPGQINYGSTGSGSLGNLAFEQLKRMAGVEMTQVPYRAVGPGLTDLLGGHISLMFFTIVTGLPQVEAGRLRALAVSSPTRSPRAPNIPTIAESGFPGFDVRGWYAILAPAGTPAPIVSRLNKDIVAILHTPEMKERLANDGSEAVGSSPEELARHLRNETARWAKLIREAGIKAAD